MKIFITGIHCSGGSMGDEEVLSTNDLIEEIYKYLDNMFHILNIPKGLMTGVAKVGVALHLSLNSESLLKLTEI